MKKAQLMSQPLIYLFYALVAVMVLFFGIRIVNNLSDSASSVEIESFVSDLRKEINTVYHDSYGSTKSLENVIVPKKIVEVCFVGPDKQLDKVRDKDLRELISVEEMSNVFFGGLSMDKNPARSFDYLEIEGTICDRTLDRKINLVLINNGASVLVREGI